MSALDAGGDLRVVGGPSALGQDLGRFVSLTRTLTVTDFKLKFYGSALGYLWQLVRPLMLFGVLYYVFTHFLKFGTVAHYPAVLLTGIVLYSFFGEAISTAVDSVVRNEPLVRKVQFPRLVIPASSVATAFLNVLLNLVAVFVFIVVFQHVRPHWQWLEFPLVMLALLVLTSGVAMLVSSLYVRYRDLRPITDVVLQVLFYGTPIFYPVERVAPTLRHVLLMVNPLAPIVQQARHSLIDPHAPTAAAAAGGTLNLMVPIAMTLGLFALGFWVFNREAPRIAEEL
ncbi:MAG: ABC transporter permease [Thermoleophilaceae bacterium]